MPALRPPPRRRPRPRSTSASERDCTPSGAQPRRYTSSMTTSRLAARLLLILCIASLAALVGCGNKGDLVRPGPAPPASAG
ncbi:LPS translocon maturation chaperone LptM [Pseudomarimonas salicorniae]|uniref:LPS translocon maturation chaperone LptM n=1 Tax=Pseudomarimonas salicorniae TaxID=2933270 RepID=UPI003CCE33F8